MDGQGSPGVSELRDQDEDWWYRLLYWLNAGWIYVVHCFKKTTNKTSQGDIEVARQRTKAIKARKDAPAEKEEKSA
jgi:phage-related protein